MKPAGYKSYGLGFTRLELIAILSICALVMVPLVFSTTYRTAARSQRIECANHLKQLGLTFKTWALDHGDKFPGRAAWEKESPLEQIEEVSAFKYFQVLSNELATPRVLICPADTRSPPMHLGPRMSNSNLSYFLGLDATDTNPQMFLIGDRNLTNGPLPANHILVLNTNYPVGWTREMHHYQGNIGLADGSVQQYSNNRLSEALRGIPSTNRLAMP